MADAEGGREEKPRHDEDTKGDDDPKTSEEACRRLEKFRNEVKPYRSDEGSQDFVEHVEYHMGKMYLNHEMIVGDLRRMFQDLQTERFDHKKWKAQKVANLDNFKFDSNGNAASFVTELERLSGEVDPSVTEEEIIAKARGKLPPMMAAIACSRARTG
ncbi:unnamed protein product, partial [Allacma fusca]